MASLSSQLLNDAKPIKKDILSDHCGFVPKYEIVSIGSEDVAVFEGKLS